MSSNDAADYGAVRRCVAELEEMWLSVPDARALATEVPSLDPDLACVTDAAAFLSQPWEQAAAVQARGPAGLLAVAGMRNWLQGMLRSAEQERGHAEALVERWVQDPEWLGAEDFADPRERLLERLEETVAGLALTIGDERPEGDDAAEFRINWQPDGDGLGYWNGAPSATAFSLREAIEDNAELLGEFPHGQVPVVTKMLLRDLRHGLLVLPLLPRSERSTRGTTWLRWSGPGSPDEQGLLLPEAAEQAGPAEAAGSPEDVLRRCVPELACLYDEARALADGGLDLSGPKSFDQDDSSTPLGNGRGPFAAELVSQLGRLTGLPAEALVRFLILPLQVIVRLAVRETVQRRARLLLEALRALVR
jgi:hypothetical protein